MNEISNNNLVLLSTFDVTSADTDVMARLRLGGLVNFLVQSAINSADELGFGFGGLRRQQLFWVLSRMTVEIYQPLKWYDKALVETWPKNVEGLLYLRDFIVKNQHDEVMAKCTSGWLAIDILSKRPRKVESRHEYIFERMKDRHALQETAEKLSSVVDGLTSDVKAGYFDLDLNKHVTSTRYIDWMMNTIPVEYHHEHYPTRLSINYMKETLYGETIRLIRTSPAEKCFIFNGVDARTDVSKFRGKIDFK